MDFYEDFVMIFGKGERKDFINEGSKRVYERVENWFEECKSGIFR